MTQRGRVPLEQPMRPEEKVAKATDLLNEVVDLLRDVMTDIRHDEEDGGDATDTGR